MCVKIIIYIVKQQETNVEIFACDFICTLIYTKGLVLNWALMKNINARNDVVSN